MILRNIFPAEFRLRVRVLRRSLTDYLSGETKQFAWNTDREKNFPYSIALSQPIKNTQHFENKINNLKSGINQIDGLVLKPQEIFSFWRLIKQPNEKNGYKIGRNIISGQLKEDFGGGLCQLASIIYHISIIAGLKIKERHNHSVDIYKEHERFTPLGADASVVYGYKDLRILNDSEHTFKFSFRITEDNLLVTLFSTENIPGSNIEFTRKTHESNIEVETKIVSGTHGFDKVIDKSFYMKRA